MKWQLTGKQPFKGPRWSITSPALASRVVQFHDERLNEQHLMSGTGPENVRHDQIRASATVVFRTSSFMMVTVITFRE
jgi:hypothetical protein